MKIYIQEYWFDLKFKNLFFYLFSIFLAFSGNVFSADSQSWPQPPRPIYHIFNPWLTSQFSDMQGLKRFKTQAEYVQHYLLRSPTGKWKTSLSCDEPARRAGYLQTTRYVHQAASGRVRIEWPVSIRLATSFIGQKKENILNRTLLNIQVFALDGDDGDLLQPGLTEDQIRKGEDTGSYNLVQLNQFSFKIRDFCSLSDDCRPALERPGIPVRFNFNSTVLTDSFSIENGTLPYEVRMDNGRLNLLNRGKIRVRAQWFFDGICDEDEFEFKVGDQIRIVHP